MKNDGSPNQPWRRFPAMVPVRAWLVGERLDTHALEGQETLGLAPLALPLGDSGVVVLFRYGAAVFFNVDPAVADGFIARLRPLLTDPFDPREKDEARLRIDPAAEEQVEPAAIVLREPTIERLQAVAITLAKSLMLSHYEAGIARIFDLIDPLAANLAQNGTGLTRGRDLTQHIGRVLLIQHKMIGRVETSEKPELLWEHPELERLYARLAEEYELRDRDRALDRKLEVVAHTVETLLGLVQSRSSLRVEWYILALIVAELLLSLYPAHLW